MLRATVQFCGAGGTSEAAFMSGIRVEAAINHSEIAMATHQANHPACLHFRQSMEACNPDDMPDSDLLLTSPCCTNHSAAKGQKQYHQFDLFGDIVYDPLAERSRNTMDDVTRFAAAKVRAGHPYRCIVVENVVDVLKWRKYAAWLTSLTTLGYAHQTLSWNSQFFGVPQSRDRVYIVFWLPDAMSAPDLDHRPAAWCVRCARMVSAVQSWKSPTTKAGCYREQYVYCCPGCTHEVTPECTPVRSILDLNNPGRPMGGRLVQGIQDNIARGLKRLPGEQFLYGYYKNPLYRRLGEPVGTITTVDRWALITPAARLEDTLHRMLTAREVKAAMGFPAQYRVLGSAKQQVWQLGNAVCPPVMATILSRCVAALSAQARVA